GQSTRASPQESECLPILALASQAGECSRPPESRSTLGESFLCCLRRFPGKFFAGRIARNSRTACLAPVFPEYLQNVFGEAVQIQSLAAPRRVQQQISLPDFKVRQHKNSLHGRNLSRKGLLFYSLPYASACAPQCKSS